MFNKVGKRFQHVRKVGHRAAKLLRKGGKTLKNGSLYAAPWLGPQNSVLLYGLGKGAQESGKLLKNAIEK